jgi:hypothetical protein
MTKLTDTQLIVLSSAAKHDDGLATRPANLNAAPAAKVASSLINKGLAREIRAKADAPMWHENDDGRFALKITRAGRAAIGVDDEHAQDAASAAAAPVTSKSKKGRSKLAAQTDVQKAPAARGKGPRKPLGETESSPAQIRAGSKQAKIVDLMKRPKGATLDERSKQRTGCRTRRTRR